MNLILCSTCRRHIRETSSDCPFCGASAPAALPDETSEIPRGLSRAALVVLGASMALGACGNSNTRGGDESRIVQPYGAPPHIVSAPPQPSESAPPPSSSAPGTKEIAK